MLSIPHMCNDSRLSRRELLRSSVFGALAASGWFSSLAAGAAQDRQRKRSCILLWMSGGPSQMDTFDLKPNHENGGPTKAIETAVPGVRISEHLPKLAQMMNDVVPIYSMQTAEGDHARGTYLMRTGHPSRGPIRYPSIGSLLSKELGFQRSDLPGFVSIGANRFLNPAAYGPGFLGPRFAPLVVGDGVNQPNDDDDYERALRVRNLALPRRVTVAQADARTALLDDLEEDYAAERPGAFVDSHQAAYRGAIRMMKSSAIDAFNLTGEPAPLRDRYGRNRFGQSCLLARRLIETGVPFVEVSLGGWDTHQNNFVAVESLCQTLDPAWSTLLADLDDRGLLDSTLVIWMGEFGRTPRINRSIGRDHFPAAWSTALCGGGVRGGATVGRTSESGMEVEDRPVPVRDLLSTVCHALGIDPSNQNVSNVGRPIRLTDPEAAPIQEILA